VQGFKCEKCQKVDGLDEMGPEVWCINYDHFPVGREDGCLLNPNRPWKAISDWASNGNIGKLIEELEHVRLLHRKCHTLGNL
jgi:hypothetical protein